MFSSNHFQLHLYLHTVVEGSSNAYGTSYVHEHFISVKHTLHKVFQTPALLQFHICSSVNSDVDIHDIVLTRVTVAYIPSALPWVNCIEVWAVLKGKEKLCMVVWVSEGLFLYCVQLSSYSLPPPSPPSLPLSLFPLPFLTHSLSPSLSPSLTPSLLHLLPPSSLTPSHPGSEFSG